MQGFLFCFYAFFVRNVLQMLRNIVDLDSVEIKYLTPAKYSGYYFVFFCGSKNEYGVGGWLFKCFQKSIERLVRKHVHLINDIDFILARLRCISYLIYQVSYVLNRVV